MPEVNTNIVQHSLLAWGEDVYSPDDYVNAVFGTPPGTNRQGITRMRIHSNCWVKTNSAGTKEYVSAYDVLNSLCITMQWRLYAYQFGWHFIPAQLQGQGVDGTQLTNAIGATYGAKTLNARWAFQVDENNNVRQKARNWNISFSPPHNECRVTRDSHDGQTLLVGYNNNVPTTYANNTLTFEGADTASEDEGYWMQVWMTYTNTALSAGDGALGNVVLRTKIKWGQDDDSPKWYKNTLEDQSGVLNSVGMAVGAVDYNPVTTTNPEFSDTEAYYYVLPTNPNSSLYDPNLAGTRTFVSEPFLAPPPTEKQGLSIEIDFLVFDENGSLNGTYKGAITANIDAFLLRKFSGEEVQNVPSFDIVAKAETGRGKINLGRTHVGALGYHMGRIDVQTSAGVYGSTDNWNVQAVDDPRSINTLCVEETLQNNNDPKGVERGTIVLRGTSATIPSPFDYFRDASTATDYACLNYTLHATQCELDVTLRKTGRDAITITTAEENTGKGLDRPSVAATGQKVVEPVSAVRGYNVQANEYFAQDWSSVIGAGETLEAYYTVLPDGTGKKTNHQGETPATGYTINRKVYFRTLGLHQSTGAGWVALPINQPDENDTLEQAFEKIDIYMSALQNASYSFLITYKEVSNYLLDTYSGATAAYGLRKLRAGYTGNCIRVRRSSDSQTQDIGFNGDDLDTAALTTFVGNGNGYVQIWYDQSTHGRTAQQFTTSAQPKIVHAGNVITRNGKPAVEFDGSNDYLKTTATWPQNPNGALNLALVYESDTLSVGQYIFNSWTTSSASQVWGMNTMTNGKLRTAARYTNNALPRMDTTSALSTATQYIATATFDGNTTLAYINGTEEDDKYNQGTASLSPRNTTLAVAIGARQSDGGLDFNGKIHECIVWSNSTAHDADAIGDALNEHFSAY